MVHEPPCVNREIQNVQTVYKKPKKKKKMRTHKYPKEKKSLKEISGF